MLEASLSLAALLLVACSDYDLMREDNTPSGGDDSEVTEDTDPKDSSVDTAGADDSEEPNEETPPDAATEPLYAHSSTTLYSLDPKNPSNMTKVADFVGASDVTDIAIDLDGQMYAVSFGSLYKVDASNGKLTRLAATPAEVNAMTFLSDGRLLVGGGTALYEVNLSTNKFTPMSKIGSWSFDGDMVGLPDGLLYCAMSGGTLVVWDPTTGAVSKTGKMGTSSLYGFAYAEGQLFGFNEWGEVLVIDPTTSKATKVADQPAAFWGAATNPAKWE